MKLPKDFTSFAKGVEMAAASKPTRDRMAAYTAPERKRDIDRALAGLVISDVSLNDS